jgi:cytidylate kinase
MSVVPVIAIDGPTASGKGTIAQAVARELGFGCLDSGALYRVVALLALRRAIDPGDAQALAPLAGSARPRFAGGRVELEGEDVSEAIRTEEVGRAASRVAAHAAVRDQLLELQRSFRRWPGLVADGRDMGTVVFPDARLKVFLTASVEVRAERRLKQLMGKGYSGSLRDLLLDLRERDERDRTRAVAPLKAADDAFELDASGLTIDEVVASVLARYRTVAQDFSPN